jgi:aminoglycoside 3-N-acetyltransferase
VKEVTINELSFWLKDTPMIIHINPVGLAWLGENNKQRYSSLDIILNDIQNNGGNIAVPTYSYSYTKDEVYDVYNTPSALNEVSEFLRKENIDKRTADANFSYLMFGSSFSSKHLKVLNYSTFGKDSLIDEVYNKDGYLGVIGDALEYLTEVHYLEKRLDVSYRFDKIFKGASINADGEIIHNQLTYFCRDLKSNYSGSLLRLKEDIRLEGIVKKWKLKEHNIIFEVVKIQELYTFIKEKLLNNAKYLQKNQ